MTITVVKHISFGTLSVILTNSIRAKVNLVATQVLREETIGLYPWSTFINFVLSPL